MHLCVKKACFVQCRAINQNAILFHLSIFYYLHSTVHCVYIFTDFFKHWTASPLKLSSLKNNYFLQKSSSFPAIL